MPDVEWVTVGTVGEPGKRTFYIQARQGSELVTLKVEKQQVAALAQFLAEILSDLPAAEEVPSEETLPLAEPVEAEWAVGGLQIAYDTSADRIVLVAEELGGDGEDDARTDPPSEDRGTARLGLSRGQAAAIVRCGWDLVNAGRPRCNLCGHPMDPEGHSCPRTNGHRPPTP
jgi:uncharacterized repeat protein (TIGR03847 family)